MFCKNCGETLENAAMPCPKCGAAPQAAQSFVPPVVPPVVPVPPVAPVTKVVEVVPEQNKPLSPWAYFGLQLLFCIPIVGFIFLIIFSCNGSNINRRNYARSYWCALLIYAIVILVILLIAVAAGASLSALF